jgi:hypothetical protein
METGRLDVVIADLCAQAGLAPPAMRRPVRVWQLSGVERVTLADDRTVIVKYAGPPFTGEAAVLRAAAERRVPVPEVITAEVQDEMLIMLLQDLGEHVGEPTDVDGAVAAARLHTAEVRAAGLQLWDTRRFAELPANAAKMLTTLRDQGRFAGAADLLPLLDQLARHAPALTAATEIPPFGVVHGELHPTSVHIGRGGWCLLDFAKAYVGPGLLDLATWQGTRHPADIARLEAQMHAYVAAGGTSRIHSPRGGHPAAVWALGWHRLWSAGWFLRQAISADDRDDTRTGTILHRQITAAAKLLRQRG